MNTKQWNDECFGPTTFTMTSPPMTLPKQSGQAKQSSELTDQYSTSCNNATYGISILIQQEDKEQPKIVISVGGKLPHLAKFTDMDSH
jgi:hypothetical protein